MEVLEARTVPATVPTTTLTWTGAGGTDHWTDPANWKHQGDDKTPKAGDTVVFPAGAKQLTNDNDVPELTLASVRFTGEGYDVRGKPLTVTGGISVRPTALNTQLNTVEVAVTLNQTESLVVAAGTTLALNGGLTVGAGVSLAGPGTVQLAGTSSVAAGGTLSVDQGTLMVATGATLSDAGVLQVSPGATFLDSGTVTVEPSGRLVDSGTLTVEFGATLTTAGTVIVGGKGTNGTLNDYGTVSVESTGELAVGGTLTVDHFGTLTDSGSVTVGRDKVSGHLIDNSKLTVDSSGTLRVEGVADVGSGATLDNSGSVTVVGGGGELNVSAGGTILDKGLLDIAGTLDNGGDIQVSDGHTIRAEGALKLAREDSETPSRLAGALSADKPPLIAITAGTLNLGAANAPGTVLDLQAATGLAPQAGQPFTLVSNTSGNAVQGRFLDKEGNVINEGDIVRVGDFDFRISYSGGESGMDVVLFNVPVPPKQFKIEVSSQLSIPVTIDGVPLTATAPMVDLTPGDHVLGDPNNAGVSVPFSVTTDGKVDYDSKYDKILGGAGTQQLFVNGLKVALNTSLLSASGLVLDGLTVPASDSLAFQALPGTYTLADPGNAAASMPFTLNNDGKISIDPAFQNVLTFTDGTLTVQGARVTFITTGLTLATPRFTVNGQTYPTSVTGGPLPLTLLPGTINIQYTVKGVLVSFSLTLRPDGTVAPPDPSLSAYVSYQGNNVLTLRVP